MELTFDDLLSTGAHFGHIKRKWHPNYKPYILMTKRGINIINLDETLYNIEKAIHFLKEVVENGGEILFVGTKKTIKDIVQQEADKCGMFYVVERWLGGTLTNFSTIRKSIKRLQSLEKESSPLYENVTKKELLSLEREMIRLQDQHRGIKDMRRIPDALIVADTHHEMIAVKEARHLTIPVVAIVDTNTDPKQVDYPIPANDDSIRAVKLIIGELSKAICEVKDIPYPKDEEVVSDLEAGKSEGAESEEESMESEEKISVSEKDEVTETTSKDVEKKKTPAESKESKGADESNDD